MNSSEIEVHDDDFLPLQVPLSLDGPEDSGVYDLCLVFPLIRNKTSMDMELSRELHEAIERIISSVGRKYMYMYNSQRGSQRYVLIRGASSRLKSKADSVGIKIELNAENAYEYAFKGDKSRGIKSIEIVEREEVTPLKPFEYIYGRFVNDSDMEKLFAHPAVGGDEDGYISPTISANVSVRKDQTHLFKKTIRIQLLMHILQDTIEKGGAAINLRAMYEQGQLNAYFPLHQSKKERRLLTSKYLKSCAPWKLPISDICNYFGVKVAFAISFMSHYATWLMIPAILGCGCQVSTIVLWDWNRIEAVAFALLISVFAVIIAEFWKRQEKTLAMEWGTLDINNTPSEETRTAFVGKTIRSYIDGQDMAYYDPKKTTAKWISVFSFLVLCIVALAAVGAIYFVRVLYFESYNTEMSQVGASVINALVILIMTTIGRLIARGLCDLENHRTDNDYEESLIVKLFSFGFINSYSSFYYLAFGAKYVKGYLNLQNEDFDATRSVAINLAAILIFRSVLGNLIDLSLPWIMSRAYSFWMSEHKCRATAHAIRWFFCSACKKFFCRWFCCRVDLAYDDDTFEEDELYQSALQKEKARLDAKQRDKENALLTGGVAGERLGGDDEGKYNDGNTKRNSRSAPEDEYYLTPYDMDGLSDHYLEQVLVLGYMTLFVAALPGAVFLGCLCYFLEIRGFIWTLLNKRQRPMPSDCEDIGLWKSCIELMVVMAVCTNAGVSVFTMTYFDDYTGYNRVGMFVGFQYVVFILQYAIQALIRDEPKIVTIQRLRQQFITDKLIEKKPDEDHVDPMALL
jgi:hypothetical protein